MADERTFVIVGASLAGAKAAETLRAEGFAGRIVLIGEETERPYERPPLSKGYLQGRGRRGRRRSSTEELVRRTRRRAAARRPRHRARPGRAHRHPRRRRAARATTSCCSPPDRGRARLDVPGADLTGVRYLRTVDRVRRAARRAALRRRHVVVVGAGWIGLETAAAAREHGATVTVVEVADAARCTRVLGDEVGDGLRATCTAPTAWSSAFGAGVARVQRHRRRADRRGRSPTAPSCPPTSAVVGVGIQPNTELAEDGRARRSTTASSSTRPCAPPTRDIYAAGDVANARPPAARPAHPGRALGQRAQRRPGGGAVDAGPGRAYDRGAVLLLRPVRPRHGVLRLRRARRLRPGRVPRRPGPVDGSAGVHRVLGQGRPRRWPA